MADFTPTDDGISSLKFLDDYKILTPTPKSSLTIMISKMMNFLESNYLALTSRLKRIVTDSKFQHLIRICIILNSLRLTQITS